MTHFHTYLATAAVAITLAGAGATAQADVTTLTFEIVNNTSGPLTLKRSGWDLSLAAPGFFDVAP